MIIRQIPLHFLVTNQLYSLWELTPYSYFCNNFEK